jgi:hypothetical protein
MASASCCNSMSVNRGLELRLGLRASIASARWSRSESESESSMISGGLLEIVTAVAFLRVVVVAAGLGAPLFTLDALRAGGASGARGIGVGASASKASSSSLLSAGVGAANLGMVVREGAFFALDALGGGGTEPGVGGTGGVGADASASKASSSSLLSASEAPNTTSPFTLTLRVYNSDRNACFSVFASATR